MAGRGRGLRQALDRLQRSRESSSDSSDNEKEQERTSGRGRLRQALSRLQRAQRSSSDSSENDKDKESGASASASGQEESASEQRSTASASASASDAEDVSETTTERSEPSTRPSSAQSGQSEEESDSTSQATSESSTRPSSAQSVQSEDTSASSAPSPSPTPPESPKVYGSIGQKMRVTANYIRISYQPTKGVFLYSVKFEPMIESFQARKRILNTCQDIREKIGSCKIFTGMNMFLPFRSEEPIVGYAEGPDPSLRTTITIEFVKQPPNTELIAFYNNLFNQVMRELKLVQINRHHYDPEGRVHVPNHKLEIWPGHVCAIQEFDDGLMLNCDTSHRVLRMQTAHDMLGEVYNRNRDNFREAANKAMLGCTVLTRYNNKTYRIDDIDTSQNPLSKFTLNGGEEITYLEYFKRTWNTEIKDKRQPLLIHRPKPRRGQPDVSIIALIPELSYLTGLTDDLRKNTHAMKDLAAHTRLKPEARWQKLVQFVRRVNTTASARKILDDWGLTLDPQPITTEARNFGAQKLIFGAGKEVTPNREAMWRNDATNSKVVVPKNVQRWVLIFNERDRQRAQELSSQLQNASGGMGFSFNQPKPIPIQADTPRAYIDAIKANSKGAELIVIMTPMASQREDRYGAIKRLCCTDLGIPTQCVRANTLGDVRKVRSICQNIALQIVCKMGGAIWRVQHPMKSVMVIGMDAYHDPRNKSRSVLGFIASIDNQLTRWYSRCFFQDKKEEIASTLKTALIAALKRYYQENNTLPERIFLYRDGVGDGDLPVLQNFEIPQLHAALDSFTEAGDVKRPLLTFTVVQKRIDAKILVQNGPRLDNPPPGTVCDKTITRKNRNDFYLISQHVMQGTVNPTHYVTLLDENQFYPDKVQKFTYMLTHLYYNFPAAIRVPGPCQYAHKAAYLMGQYCEKDALESLRDSLYFL